MPALLTRASIDVNRASAVSTIVAAVASSPMWPSTSATWSDAVTAVDWVTVREVATTLKPRSINPCTMPAPIPCEAPVTMAVFRWLLIGGSLAMVWSNGSTTRVLRHRDAGMVGRSRTGSGPEALPSAFGSGNVVDACFLASHHAALVQLPPLISITAAPLAGIGVPLVLEVHADTEKPCRDASPIDGEHDAEPHSAAVHVLVGVRHAMKRIFLDHRVYTSQDTEFQDVLRIPRSAGVPARHGAPPTDERHHIDRQRLRRRGRHQQGAADR